MSDVPGLLSWQIVFVKYGHLSTSTGGLRNLKQSPTVIEFLMQYE